MLKKINEEKRKVKMKSGMELAYKINSMKSYTLA
jgi:hypothetical protein